MDRRIKAVEFVDYLSKPISVNEMYRIYTVNNINYYRCELYKDFLISLTDLVLSTFMGDDVMDSQDKKNHFNWCLKTVVNSFKEENIEIKISETLFDYLYYYFVDCFYSLIDKDMESEDVYFLWDYLFDYSERKSKSDMESLIDIYHLMEGNI